MEDFFGRIFDQPATNLCGINLSINRQRTEDRQVPIKCREAMENSESSNSLV